MQLTLPSTPTPASLAVTLLVEIYGQHVPSLSVASGSQLSLISASGSNSSTLPTIAAALLEAGGKLEVMGSTDEEKGEVSSWLEKIGAGAYEGEAGLKSADEILSTRTYLVGTKVTAADIALFASVHSYIAGCTHSTLLSHPSLTRHFDHIQNLPLISSILARSSAFNPAVVPIDADNVPIVEVQIEIKAKKPKDVEAAAVVPEKVVEAVEEQKVAATEGGEKKPKKEKKAAAEGTKKAAPAAPVVEAPAPWMVDLRVGKIIDVQRHPDADTLYVETIDVGEAEPRTVVSGLVNYIPIEEMRGRTLITVCNLKPANMRGVKSFAMVLCASSREGKDGGVEFVDPPAGSLPGDRVYFSGFESQQALDILNPKKKIFETVQPGFTTLDTYEACWIAEDKTVHKIMTDKGVCKAKTFKNASLS